MRKFLAKCLGLGLIVPLSILILRLGNTKTSRFIYLWMLYPICWTVEKLDPSVGVTS